MGFDVRSDLRAASLLSALGFDPRQVMANLDQRGQMGGLDELGDGFDRMGDLGPAGVLGLLQRGAVGNGLRMPLPGERERRFSRGWPDTEGSFEPSQFPEGSAGERLARFFQRRPFARQELERQLGGRIVPNSLSPAGFRVQQFAPGAFPGGGVDNDAALSAFGTLAGIDRGASLAGGPQFGGPNAFQNLMLGAFAQMADQQAERVQQQQGGRSRVLTTADLLDMNPDGTPRGAAASRAQALNAFPGGGANFGSGGFAPGFPAFGNATGSGFAPGADLSNGAAIMNEPGLTVEDKVCLLIMIIMKQMDQQIEAQANYINSLQQQQQSGGGGGKGGKGGGGGSGAPSIDVETMKLKRLIDKRSQMFDMLRQIIDKYNQTAKGIIDSMGR